MKAHIMEAGQCGLLDCFIGDNVECYITLTDNNPLLLIDIAITYFGCTEFKYTTWEECPRMDI